MATPEETRLVLQIEANVKSLERAMKQSGILVKQATDAVNDNFRKAGVTVDRTAKQIEGSMRNATRNLGFQFQDVATQLLSGQSPFTVAAQQSSQAAAAMQDLGRSGGLLKGVFGALGSVISPQALGISAAILGFGYLTQAAREYFEGAYEGSAADSAFAGDLGKGVTGGA
ncbi:phage tail length tape measure family protein [Ensifer sp. ENS07]|uniref:phage tail length tape measure family protein n=1 Tax=unclassified Ensifer TaxID=2633371 RepID=UPI00177D6623|nr:MULTISPECIES: phage tail length tape measure family protein [unclassified Ensifer]MBD9507934.1 phage tail length tape measure family protein [Ensifer sp. ENS10]MBD9637569.1 phage tail length tape measure family protein [Ensifer sp. ENS07]